MNHSCITRCCAIFTYFLLYFSATSKALSVGSRSSSSSALMMSKGAAEIANFAVRQSPSSTQFITNKMCPFAQKAWIALNVCGAPFEMEEISLYGANGKPSWFLELNPDGTVPVLTCYGGAVILPDSDLILDAVVDGAVEGGSVLKANEEAEQLVSDFRKRIQDMLPVGKSVVQGNKSKQKQLTAMLQGMDNLVVGPFLCGDKPTLADCAAFPFIWRLNEEFALESFECPKLQTWLDHCGETEAFSKTVQSNWWWWW